MSVLVTGGTGALGSLLGRALVERGVKTILFDERVDTRLVSDLTPELVVISGDVLDWAGLVRAVREHQVDRIAHLASAVAPADHRHDKLSGWRIDLEGTFNVLEVARTEGIRRLVFTSSHAVYGELQGEYAYPTYKPVTEDHPQRPDTVYGAAKVACELLGQIYWRKHGVDFIALRFASTYGPRKPSIHQKIIENAMLGQPTRIPAGGDELNDTLYNRDAANAVVQALFVDSVEDRVFNVASGEAATLRDLAAELLKLFPEATIEIGPGTNVRGSGMAYCSKKDFSKAQRQLGYEAQFPLRRAVPDYVETMRRFGIQPIHRP